MPVFSLLLGVSSGCARPITVQVASVTLPMIGWAESGLTPRKRQKTGPDINNLWYNRRMTSTRHTDNSKIEVKDYQYHHCDIKCIIFDMQNADHFSKYLTKTYQRIRIVQIAIAYIVILFHVTTTLKSVWWGINIFYLTMSSCGNIFQG